jgi:hypothetical protein
MVTFTSLTVPLVADVISHTQLFAGIVASLNVVVVAPDVDVTVRFAENTLFGVPEFRVLACRML